MKGTLGISPDIMAEAVSAIKEHFTDKGDLIYSITSDSTGRVDIEMLLTSKNVLQKFFYVNGEIMDCETYAKKVLRKPGFKSFVDLTGIKDSMQLDSDTVIASLKTEKGSATLEVRGYVNVDWCPEGSLSGESVERYSVPSEFPNELKKLIDEKPYEWRNDDRVYVVENNWFEVFYTDEHGRSGQCDTCDPEGNSENEVYTLLYETIEDCYNENHKK